MSTYQICFSPTGGTKKVSEYLSRQLNEDSINIDLTDCKRDFRDIALTGNDIAVIAVPSYGGRVPSPAVERIKQIQGTERKPSSSAFMAIGPTKTPWPNRSTAHNKPDFQ